MKSLTRNLQLTLVGLALQSIGFLAHATCGTQSGTDYTISANTASVCSLPTTATSLTVDSGVTISGTATVSTSIIPLSTAISVLNGTAITSITNNGTIAGTGGDIGIVNKGTITTLSNFGSISGSIAGVFNDLNGSITTLNNAQNGLKYAGTLPTYYNIIITNTGHGTLDGTGQSSGSTTFGVSSLSTLAAGSYQDVITGGINTVMVSNTGGSVRGTTNGYDWTLTYDGANWDLSLVRSIVVPSGPSAADTQDALKQSATALRSVYNVQTAVVNNSLNYDCTTFAQNNVCVSGGGRFAMTNNITGEQMSTLLVAAYKANSNIRVGAFIDQNVPTANIAGINLNKSPMYGVFGVWNERPDALGYEVRLSSSWSNQDITQTRNVVGTSEAGVGTAALKSQATSAVISYAIPVEDTSWVASPYAGIRKTKATRSSYTETSAVTTPLTYSDLSQDITTALAGLRMTKKYNDDLQVTASMGVEQNIGSNISSLNASGVTGLTATDFSTNYAKTRPVASAGLSYTVAKNQRISLSAMYRKEAFQASGSTTALLMYQVGL